MSGERTAPLYDTPHRKRHEGLRYVTCCSSYGYVTNDKTGKCERDEEFKSEVTFCLDGYKHEVESSG